MKSCSVISALNLNENSPPSIEKLFFHFNSIDAHALLSSHKSVEEKKKKEKILIFSFFSWALKVCSL